MDTNNAKPTVWVAAPDADCIGWSDWAIHEDEAPTMADAHEFAHRMRRIFHGHLFAVTDGRRPMKPR